jgi:hypothetical protein
VGDAQEPGTPDSRRTGGRRRRAAEEPIHAVAETDRRHRPGAAS